MAGKTRAFAKPRNIAPFRPPSVRRPLPGAPPARPTLAFTAKELSAVPPQPRTFVGPSTEWAVYWVLTKKLGAREGRDFVRQFPVGTVAAIGGPTNGKGFTRTDFWIVPTGRLGRDLRWPKGIIINPISPLTHPDLNHDRRERDALNSLGWGEIFIDWDDLEKRPIAVVKEALRGIDTSSHRA